MSLKNTRYRVLLPNFSSLTSLELDGERMDFARMLSTIGVSDTVF
jgi:hypothetical protein